MAGGRLATKKRDAACVYSLVQFLRGVLFSRECLRNAAFDAARGVSALLALGGVLRTR